MMDFKVVKVASWTAMMIWSLARASQSLAIVSITCAMAGRLHHSESSRIERLCSRVNSLLGSLEQRRAARNEPSASLVILMVPVAGSSGRQGSEGLLAARGSLSGLVQCP